MKTLIYMSEEIKKDRPNPDRVTIIQQGDEIKYAGNLKLVKDGQVVAQVLFDQNYLQSAPQHLVRAWIETDCEVL